MSIRAWHQQKIVHYRMRYRDRQFDKFEIVGRQSEYLSNDQFVDFVTWYNGVVLARIEGQAAFWRKPKCYQDNERIDCENWYDKAVLCELEDALTRRAEKK